MSVIKDGFRVYQTNSDKAVNWSERHSTARQGIQLNKKRRLFCFYLLSFILYNKLFICIQISHIFCGLWQLKVSQVWLMQKQQRRVVNKYNWGKNYN